VDQEAEAQLAHALFEAVMPAAAAEVRPAVDGPGTAGDQQAEDGDLDAVAVGVVVEGGEIVQRQGGVRAVQEVVDHRAGDVVEGLDDRRGHPGAAAQRRTGGGQRGAGGLVDLRARLDRQRLGDLDRLTEVVLDPDRPDSGLGQELRVARRELDPRPQQRRRAGRPRDDVAGQLHTVANLARRDQTHCLESSAGQRTS
jgi:hypothetical protein